MRRAVVAWCSGPGGSLSGMSIPGVRGRRDPRSVLGQVEVAKRLPSSDLERFHGWGVLGLPFTSGHVLGLRRWPASSIGPPYTSVWHRAPHGLWSFWSTAQAQVSCNRYAGEMIMHTAQSPITLSWPGDWTLRRRSRAVTSVLRARCQSKRGSAISASHSGD